MQTAPTDRELRERIIEAGAWFWYRAKTPSENIESGFHRAQYKLLIAGLTDEQKPTAHEMYGCAASRWPKSRLHSAPPKAATKPETKPAAKPAKRGKHKAGK